MSQNYNINAYLTKEAFIKVKDNPELSVILTFSRIINSLQYSLRTNISKQDFHKPSSVRIMFNSFFYSCAALYEGINYLEFAGQYYSDSIDARTKIKLFNKKIAKFKEAMLSKIRNNIAYHNNENTISKTIKGLDFTKYVFSITIDFKSSETYYLLADEVLLNSLLGKNLTINEQKLLIKNALNDLSLYASTYIELAQFLIAEKIKKLNLDFENEQVLT